MPSKFHIRPRFFETNSSAVHSICLEPSEVRLRDQSLAVDEDEVPQIDGFNFNDSITPYFTNQPEVKAAYAIKAWGDDAVLSIWEYCGTKPEYSESEMDAEGRIDCPRSNDEILNFIFCSTSWLIGYSQEETGIFLLECKHPEKTLVTLVIDAHEANSFVTDFLATPPQEPRFENSRFEYAPWRSSPRFISGIRILGPEDNEFDTWKNHPDLHYEECVCKNQHSEGHTVTLKITLREYFDHHDLKRVTPSPPPRW